MQKTITFHCGNTFSEKHNFDKDFRAREEHIDPSLTDRNIELVHIPLADFYHQLFDQAQEKYNQKQLEKGHPERVMTETYLSHVGNDKSRHAHNISYEIIIQIGDRKTTGIRDDEREVEILKEYIKGFQERNPNMQVWGAVIHRDERDGTTHAHLDYVPVGHGFTRGMETQNSLNRALYEMGYQTRSREDTAQRQWTDKERGELERLCRERGIDVEHKGESRAHLEKESYILHAQNKELDREIDLKREVLDTVTRDLDKKRGELDRKEEQLRELAKSPLQANPEPRGLKRDLVSRDDYNKLYEQANALIQGEKGLQREWRDKALSASDRAERAEKSARGEHELRLELQQKIEDKDFLKEQLRNIEREERGERSHHTHEHDRGGETPER